MNIRAVRLAVMLACATVAASVQANDWGDIAIVSGTLGNNSNRLCLGVPDTMRPADIGCPTYSPYVTSGGLVGIGTADPQTALEVHGTVSATNFVGDGSGLTNLSISGDRITSNTHAVIANAASGYVSLTTGGTTWGYLSAGWSRLANLFSNTVSSSLVSATNVSATYIDATRNGTVSGTYGYFRNISGTNIHGTFTGDGSGLTGVVASSGDRIVSGTNNATRMVAISDTGYISITQAGANAGWFDPYRGLVTLGVSATGPVSGTVGFFAERVGIGSVTGELGGVPANLFISRPIGHWGAVISGAGANQSDLLFHNSGNPADERTVQFVNRPGAFRTFEIRSLTDTIAVAHTFLSLDLVSGSIGVSNTSPKALLDVAGTISASDAIQVGTSSLTCGAGIPGAIRYNATNLQYCNGTTWTTLGAAGATTAASSTGAVQFNAGNALAGDTNNFFWDNTNKRLGIGTSVPTAQLQVSGSFIVSTSAQTSSPSLYVGTNGRVGIGTASPIREFHIEGTMGPAIRFTRPGNVFMGEFGVQGANATISGVPDGVLVTRGDGGLMFGVGNKVDMTVSPSGHVGIGTASPLAKLDVAGTISASDAIQVGQSSLACSAPISGSIRYNTTSDTLQICTGSGWKSLVSGTTGGGASALSGLTDVQLTSLAGRDHLRYDSVTSKWVNISESTVMSTTTMMDGWPDAIACFNGTETRILLMRHMTDSLVQYADATDSLDTRYYVQFNATTKDYDSHASYNGYDCVANSLSIPQLYAQGRAFNFIGNSGENGGAALGDRITSGTLAMVANSATSYVSLSTGGTDWGYLGSTASYLPNLHSTSISATLVSATNISATHVHLNSATTPLACNSGFTGAMRYTSGTMQVCDGSEWGNIGIGVPTGTIAAFAASSCPSGWSEYTASRGRFLRGIDNGAGNDPSGTRAPGDLQDDALQNLTGTLHGGQDYLSGSGTFSNNGATTGNRPNNGTASIQTVTFDASNVARTSTETRPKNVAVTFCVYSGYQSAPGQTILTTLASLTDVSVGGVTTGQVLAFDGASWVPSNSAAASTALGDRITSGTHAVTANEASGYVSLSTGGTTWGYFSSGLSYVPAIASTRISATNISGTLIQVGDGNGAACSASTKGAIRYSDTSSTVEYCQGTAWVSMGPSATAVPGFAAYLSSNQTVTDNVVTKIVFDTEEFDTHNNYDSTTGRFTPTTPGHYIVTAGTYCNGQTDFCQILIRKNASAVQYNINRGSVADGVALSTIIYLNGAGDYLEVHVRNNGGTSVIGGVGSYTRFAAALISMAGGGSGGASSLNELSDVNTSGAATGSILAYNGSGWVVSESGAGVAALASLTDVTLTNLAGRDYLRYDSVTSKWVNISESTVMSTTTMVSGWPDAIKCGRSDGSEVIFQLEFAPLASTGAYRYRHPYSSMANDVYVDFNPNGTYASASGITHDGVNGCNKSIATLYVEGRAFNFIGNSDANSAALGDRITSGTLAMVANSATSYVSLSTGGTDWGYLSGGLSYLPFIHAPTVSSTLVSATNISGTLIQVGGGNGAACSASTKGAIRYSDTSSTVEYCQGSAWTSLGPSDTVPVSFYAYRSGTKQSIAAGSAVVVDYTNITFNTGDFDTATDRFTPSVPGRYLLTATMRLEALSAGNAVYFTIRKNGTGLSTFYDEVAASDWIGGVVTVVADANGTTDYFDVIIEHSNGSARDAISGAAMMNFSGSLLGPQAGSGGGSDNLGDHTATQDLTMGTHNIVGTGLVSMTNVSATHIQLNSPTAVAACDAGMLGAIRRNAVRGLLEVCQ